MLQPLMIVAGPVLWFITKNRRWLAVSMVGIGWFVADVLLGAISLM